MGDRCTGHCCRRFYLPIGPNALQADPERYADGRVIADMLVFLEVSNVHADGTVGGKPGFWYTCRHLQSNGDCGIYERRPDMCRDFPYGLRCEYPECTWDAVATKLVPLGRRLVKGVLDAAHPGR